MASLERPHFFVICGTIVGVSALVMSFGMPAIGGVTQAAATTLLGAFFLFALSRAFSIGLAVVTIRPIIGLFFATSRFSGLTLREFFGVAFWIGFTLHLITAGAWIHPTKRGQMAVGVALARNEGCGRVNTAKYGAK